MAGLQSNDASALEILFDRYSRLVFGIARSVVRDSGEAEDVVQEAFFYLYKKSTLLTDQKAVSRVGSFKSRCTVRLTGSRSWLEEGFTLVQISARLTIHCWERRTWTVKSRPN